MDDTVADAIRVLVESTKKKGDYVKGSRVDGAIRVLENELREHEKGEQNVSFTAVAGAIYAASKADRAAKDAQQEKGGE
jgi:hypothetical protein